MVRLGLELQLQDIIRSMAVSWSKTGLEWVGLPNNNDIRGFGFVPTGVPEGSSGIQPDHTDKVLDSHRVSHDNQRYFTVSCAVPWITPIVPAESHGQAHGILWSAVACRGVPREFTRTLEQDLTRIQVGRPMGSHGFLRQVSRAPVPR